MEHPAMNAVPPDVITSATSDKPAVTSADTPMNQRRRLQDGRVLNIETPRPLTATRVTPATNKRKAGKNLSCVAPCPALEDATETSNAATSVDTPKIKPGHAEITA